MLDAVQREIIDLHDFFQTWLTETTFPQTPEAFARVTSTMGEGFYLVTPAGQLIRRPAILESIYNGYGSRPHFRMWIKNVQIRHTMGDVIVATYEEWQEAENRTTARLSTVVFTQDNGLIWQAVHETWFEPQPAS